MILMAKKKDTGVKLEVNGKILDACTTLMQAIIELVNNSKELQKEILAQGKVSVFVDKCKAKQSYCSII